MQFLIIAYDGTDEGALKRRMAAREAHLVGARAMKANGSMIVGGAILDDQGRMVGSSCIVEFPDRAACGCVAGRRSLCYRKCLAEDRSPALPVRSIGLN